MRGIWMIVLGVLASLIAQPARAEGFARCEQADYLASFDARLHPEPCEVVASATVHWHGGSAIVRVIRPRSLPAGDSAAIGRFLQETAVDVGQAMDAMGGGLTLPETTILMSSFVSPREVQEGRVIQKGTWKAEALGIFGQECPVNYYKSHYAGTGGDFVFTLAHELFHCIQFASFRAMPDQGWLVEGSAEYFAHLAKHQATIQFADQFNQAIPSTALDAMDYPAFVFYAWLGNANGPPKVKEFLAAARSIDGAVSSDMLMQFAKAYYETSIRLPDGRSLPVSPPPGPTVAVHGAMRFASPAVRPYTFSSQMLAFDRGKRFELSEEPAPADSRTLWRQGGSGLFGPTPTTVRTCSGEVRYQVIRTATRSGRAASYGISAASSSSTECACPAGVWQETPASTRNSVEQSATGGGGAHYISGTRILTLNPDHTGSFTYNAVEKESRTSAEFWLHQVVTGGTHFTWKVVNGILLTRYTGSNNLVTLNNELHSPRGVVRETRQSGAQSIGHNFNCDDGGLHLIGPQGYRPSFLPAGTAFNYNVDMHFVRIGGVPEAAEAP
ncbi:MAG: hypothetical protein ABL926_02635 [Novosphingobium sp.]|uniref:hypothetical protein n=1 Tax=Novosphingobium sp. TaxID=1874826 RepID=UPI0032B7A4E1